jgi:hypothetical protein
MRVAEWRPSPPMMRTFKSSRTRAGYLIVCAPFSIAASVVLAQRSVGINEVELHFLNAVLILLIVCLVGMLIRLPWAATVQVRDTIIVYRSILRTRKIPIEEVVRAQITTRWRLGLEWALPTVDIRDGKRVLLTEFQRPATRGMSPDQDLVDTINERINGPPGKSY